MDEIKVIKSVTLKYNKITSIFFGILYASIILEYTFGWLIGGVFIRNGITNDNFDRNYEMKDIYIIF